MKKLVTYQAYNYTFNEVFEDCETKKITQKIKSFCPTGFVVDVKDISDEEAISYNEKREKELQEYIDFQKKSLNG